MSRGVGVRFRLHNVLHDRGGFSGIQEDSRGLAAAGKSACSPRLRRKKGAPSRTCIAAVLHLQILSPRPSIPAELQSKSPQRILLLRGTADFGPQLDHDVIAGAHFREQCPLSRRRADPGPSRPEPGAPGSTRAFSRARMSSRCGSRPLSATSSTRALG